MAFKTPWHTQYKKPLLTAETFTQPSKTVPNQAYTVVQLLDRQRRGLSTNVGLGGVYHSEYDEKGEEIIHDIPDWRSLDLSERQELIEETRERIAKMQLDLSKMTAERQKLELEEKVKAEKERKEQLQNTVKSIIEKTAKPEN